MAIIRWRAGAVPEAWAGRANQWFDGDTIRVDGGPPGRVIRIFGIDAPEWGQTGAGAAWRFLRDSTLRTSVFVSPKGLDRFGRVVARLATYEIQDLGLALLTRGLVWWEWHFAPEDEEYRTAQFEARQRGLALWSRKPYGWAPWAWRRRHR
jgi:endonuclease YncB( thermonuclease family)